VAPFIANFAETLGMKCSSQSALAAGLVMGIMNYSFRFFPLSDERGLMPVPQSFAGMGSLALGSTPNPETMKKVHFFQPCLCPAYGGGSWLAAFPSQSVKPSELW